MRDVNLLLTNDEKRTRFQWLIAFLVVMAFGLIGQIVDLFNPQAGFKVPYPAYAPYLDLGILAGTILFAVIQYYCIYVKNGTRWLTLILIVLPLNFVGTIYAMAYPNPAYPVSTVRLVAILLVMAAYWVLSLKMRKVNKRIQNIEKNSRS